LKDLTKALKREKRHFESESLKERARADQLQDIIRILGI